MFLIRRAKIEDVPTLYKLARMVHFINLPADKDLIGEKVMRSRTCFMRLGRGGDPRAKDGERDGGGVGAATRGGSAATANSSDLYMFVLEEAESGGVVGTSQLIAKMGGPGAPNVALKLSRREMFSQSLQQGMTHITAQLELDESGPTEIGGLILQPSYRGHKAKLGRFLSHVRLHFIGLHRKLFADRILAEMMGAIASEGAGGGGNTLWEYLGRRFINLTYLEADRYCQHSKEFITALMPREEIYLTLLPPEARGVIAQVGPETLPARKMLERLGFAYRDRIDPFDGGPHLEARTDDLVPVRATYTAPLASVPAAAESSHLAIVSAIDSDGEFWAVQAGVNLNSAGEIEMSAPAIKALNVEPGAELGVTPYAPLPSASRSAAENGSKQAAPSRAAPPTKTKGKVGGSGGGRKR